MESLTFLALLVFLLPFPAVSQTPLGDELEQSVNLKQTLDLMADRYGARAIRDLKASINLDATAYSGGFFTEGQPQYYLNDDIANQDGMGAFFRPEILRINVVDVSQLHQFLSAYQTMRATLIRQGIQENDDGIYSYRGTNSDVDCTPYLLKSVRNLILEKHALTSNQKLELARLFETADQFKQTLRDLELHVDQLSPFQRAELARLENWGALSLLMVDKYYAKSYLVSYQGQNANLIISRPTEFRPYALVQNEKCDLDKGTWTRKLSLLPGDTLGPLRLIP